MRSTTLFNASIVCIVLAICAGSARSQVESPATKVSSPVEDAPLPDIMKCCPLSTITLSNASATESLKRETLPVPQNKASDYLRGQGSLMAEPGYNTQWSVSQGPVYYQPLYFEDPNLERCGAGHGLATELVSAVRFFGRAPLIPYMIGSQSPHQCVRSLGDCEVCQRYGKTAYLPKLNARGVAFETAAIVGLVFLLP